MARPGIMIYFDMLGPIRVLPDADKGRLLVAMLEYGQSGKLPNFDGILALAWGFVQPKIDRDDESYEKAMLQRKYAGFCKSRASMNLPKISFEDWSMLDENERERMKTGGIEPMIPITGGIGSYPTTTATASTSTITTSTSTAAAAASTTEPEPEFTAAANESFVKSVGGELGKNVVFLSDAQVEDLLDRMELETFDYYVSKLADFIIEKGARVKNHYETILKWWQEDSAVYRQNRKEIPKGASGSFGQAEVEAIRKSIGTLD